MILSYLHTACCVSLIVFYVNECSSFSSLTVINLNKILFAMKQQCSAVWNPELPLKKDWKFECIIHDHEK